MVLTLFNCHQFCFFCTDLHSVSWGCSVHLFDELGWLVLLPFLLSDGRVSLSGVGDVSHKGRYSCPCGILLVPRLLCPLPGVSVYSGWSWASPCLHGSNWWSSSSCTVGGCLSSEAQWLAIASMELATHPDLVADDGEYVYHRLSSMFQQLCRDVVDCCWFSNFPWSNCGFYFFTQFWVVVFLCRLMNIQNTWISSALELV